MINLRLEPVLAFSFIRSHLVFERLTVGAGIKGPATLQMLVLLRLLLHKLVQHTPLSVEPEDDFHRFVRDVGISRGNKLNLPLHRNKLVEQP